MGELGIGLDCEGAFCIKQGVIASFCNDHKVSGQRCPLRTRFLRRYIIERNAFYRGISLSSLRTIRLSARNARRR